MSSLVFPTLPGLDIAVVRTESYSTLVQAAASGKELRAQLNNSTPTFHYTLTINALRQAGFSSVTLSDELATLTTFFETHKGQWDSFLFNDPVDGVQRRCRFEQDTLDLTRIVDKAWDGGTLKLKTVK